MRRAMRGRSRCGLFFVPRDSSCPARSRAWPLGQGRGGAAARPFPGPAAPDRHGNGPPLPVCSGRRKERRRPEGPRLRHRSGDNLLRDGDRHRMPFVPSVPAAEQISSPLRTAPSFCVLRRMGGTRREKDAPKRVLPACLSAQALSRCRSTRACFPALLRWPTRRRAARRRGPGGYPPDRATSRPAFRQGRGSRPRR